MSVALIVSWALAMAALFVRFRYRRQWWQVDVVVALTFLVVATALGTPAVGFAESALTGLLFAACFEMCVLLAAGLRGWVRRRVFDA